MDGYREAVPAGELENRAAGFQQKLRENGIDGALILQRTDLFYFSGTVQQGWLYIPASGPPFLMVFKDFERAAAETALESVISLKRPELIPDALKKQGYEMPEALGMELDVLPVNHFRLFEKVFSAAQITDVSTEIRLVRAVKSRWEINLIREATHRWEQVISKAPGFIREGRTELEVAGELESRARRLGHQGVIRMRMWGGELFYGHLISGPSAALPSYLASPTGGLGVSPAVAQGAGFNKIKRGEPVLIDYTFGFEGYISDNTRVFSLGPLPPELADAHEAMRQVQESARRAALPGVAAGDVYDIMVAEAENAGYKDFFMGASERKIRFTGHGVGLELDEFPFIAKGQQLKLEAGMTVALEPKAIFPGKGVVGTENTHVLTENGLEPLTKRDDAVFVI